jgi:LysM repeat protein
MKNKLVCLIFVLVCLLQTNLIAETPNYPQEKIDGIEYYIYTVQASEGLYAISRKFGVTQAEINTSNPEIQTGLKVGQIIKIPVAKNAKTEVVTAKSSEVVFVTHKVESKQTLYSISKLYDVSQEEIVKYNPQIEKGLQSGVLLQIPKKHSQTTPVTKEVTSQQPQPKPVTPTPEVTTKTTPEKNHNPNYIKHIVKKKETIYSLSKLYGVDASEIIKLNPLVAQNLRVNDEILIPKIDNEVGKTSPSVQLELKASSNTLNSELSGGKKHIKLVFLLPFMLKDNSSEISNDRFVDFYAGALLAVDEGKEKGISFEISTFDTGNTEQQMLDVLTNPTLKSADLIIGPAFSNQISLMSKFSKENKITTLVPFSSRINDIDSNPYLFQFNPGKDVELNFVTNLLTSNYKNANIIFANLPDISSMDEGNRWVDELKEILKKKSVKFNQVELSTPDYSDFKSSFRKGVKNIVFFNTDKFAFVNPFLNPLVRQSDGFDLVLFEQYNWKYQDIKIPAKINISPFEMSLSSVLPSKFNLKYFQIYGKQPATYSPRFDLLGYDLTMYFITLLNLHGNKMAEHAENFVFTNGIQSLPKFKKIGHTGGFINQRVYLNETKLTK